MKIANAVIVTAILVALLVIPAASAQYMTSDSTTVTVPSSGLVTIDQTNTTSVSASIAGAAGASITFNSAVYTENPQPAASIPLGAGLTHFVVISFDVNPEDFTQANITIHYTDSDIEGLTPPIVIFKYIPESNEFVEFPSVHDAEAKTLTITLNDPNDPLFAIGGAVAVTPTSSISPTASPDATPTHGPQEFDVAWIAVAVVVVIIVVLALFFIVLPKIRPK
jgi:hypothetical protein